ncbi:Vacuolar membrane protease [Frankliniella fusca]|uniref:Vacuolar membrane protease n=1 Tax=Frankliniella fusca TaxID=407009 RepID=A0AAE1GTB1_9NEOP|nr:Vacuolar membrane protease [Frankliniella fusca]
MDKQTENSQEDEWDTPPPLPPQVQEVEQNDDMDSDPGVETIQETSVALDIADDDSENEAQVTARETPMRDISDDEMDGETQGTRVTEIIDLDKDEQETPNTYSSVTEQGNNTVHDVPNGATPENVSDSDPIIVTQTQERRGNTAIRFFTDSDNEDDPPPRTRRPVNYEQLTILIPENTRPRKSKGSGCECAPQPCLISPKKCCNIKKILQDEESRRQTKAFSHHRMDGHN